MLSRSFVGLANEIKGQELSAETEIKRLQNRISELSSYKDKLMTYISRLNTALAEEYAFSRQDGQPNYAALSEIESQIISANNELMSTQNEIGHASNELKRSKEELEVIREEKEKTLFEIQQRARTTSKNITAASGIGGHYEEAGANLQSSFLTTLAALSQAAHTLGKNLDTNISPVSLGSQSTTTHSEGIASKQNTKKRSNPSTSAYAAFMGKKSKQSDSQLQGSTIGKATVYAKQSIHQGHLHNREAMVNGIINDIKNGSGKNINRERAEEMLGSIQQYSASDFGQIRYAYQNKDLHGYWQKALDAIDEYINNSPKWDGTIFRGINVTQEVANQILSQSTIDMLGPSSWSSLESVAQGYADNGPEPIKMVFVLSNNVSGASIAHISSYYSEHEVLAPSGVQYVRDKIVGDTDRIYVYVHEQEA